MIMGSIKRVTLAQPGWRQTAVDFLKLLVALILVLTAFVVTIRGGLLYVSYIRAPYSWTYLIAPLLMMAGTAIYVWRMQKE